MGPALLEDVVKHASYGCKGAAQGLGMMALLHDFGLTVSVTVHTDASAAIGIVRRAGLGKLRHLNVRYLWVQDQVKRERLWLEKVAGADNPADLATKHLSADVMRKHLESLGVRVGGGRARSAPLLGSLGRRGRRRHTSGMGPQRPEGWSKVGTESVGPQRPGGETAEKDAGRRAKDRHTDRGTERDKVQVKGGPSITSFGRTKDAPLRPETSVPLSDLPAQPVLNACLRHCAACEAQIGAKARR